MGSESGALPHLRTSQIAPSVLANAALAHMLSVQYISQSVGLAKHI